MIVPLHDTKFRTKDPLMLKNTINTILLVDACDLNFFDWGEVECLHCMPASFP